MLVHPVILLSDICWFMVVFGLVLVVILAKKHPSYQRSFRMILSHSMGMISSIILICYVSIAVLDSIHFKSKINDQTQVISILDRLLLPMLIHDEKSYSAPMSRHLLSKESVWRDGKMQRVTPRLEHVAPGIDSDAAQFRDVWGRLGFAFVHGVLSALLLLLILVLALAWHRRQSVQLVAWSLWRNDGPLAAHAGLSTVAVIWILLWCLASIMFRYHVLGTDQVGNDVLYASVKSIRTGVLIGTLTTIFMLPFALVLGLTAGYFGGWIDDCIQYIYTTLSSIPGVLLISASILALQVFIYNHPNWLPTLVSRADARLLALCLVLGLSSWTGLCRLLRGEALKLREMDFVQAAKSMKVSSFRILIRHLLPNVMAMVLIAITLDFSGLVLAEAVLSYVGVGVDPTTFSWGNMINGARLEMAREPMVWWPLFSSFIMMFVLVLSANLFADRVRDAFDPRLQQDRGE